MLGLSAELHLLRVQAAGSLLSADFEADPIGSIPNGWKASGGSWSVAVDGTQVVSQTASGASNLVAGSGAWKDYAVAADVKQPFILNASFGIEGRYQTANNGYVLLLSQQQWKLCKNSLGWFTVLASGPFAYSAGTWYRLGLTFAGAAISASINGQTIAMVSDAKFATGSIGLRATGLTEFDNVVVTAVSPGPPTAALTVSPSSGTAPLAVTADASASSTPPGTAITAYEFDFGDGVKAGPQAGAIATHQYMAVGSVGLTVTVTNSAGQTSSATAPVSVRAGPPVAALKVNPDVGPAPLAVNADASLSTTPTGTTITGYTFDFGDGLPAAPQTGSASSHQYSSPGSYVAASPLRTARDSRRQRVPWYRSARPSHRLPL